MTPPTSYTEATLKTFMHACLAETAIELGWTVMAGSYDEAVNSALLEYGQSNIALCTDISKLRALARYAAWMQVAQAVASDHIYDQTGAVRPSNFHKQALANLALAYADAAQYLGSPSAKFVELVHTQDPYVRTE